MPANNTSKSIIDRIELYTQEPMVNWLDPAQLLQTGLRAAIAATIGGFADPREMRASLYPATAIHPLPIEDGRSLWIDYVADTGDGWNPTYSVAYSVSRDKLTIPGENLHLPRADVLILGGDQIYPTPAGNSYRTRFVDPYRAAFPIDVPAQPNPDNAPLILALPGNHDWYDGLRGFNQLFCSLHDIGRWRTEQRNSYFAMRLPYGWWLWGVDLQLESEINRTQFDYFENLARTQLQPGDHVILCTPAPSWIDESERLKLEGSVQEDEARSLSYKLSSRLRSIETITPRFRSQRQIEELIIPRGAHIAAVLSGDMHHYARYQPKEFNSMPQRITCGGGGAYLLGTHDLPSTLRFRCNYGDQHYDQAATYPDVATSRDIRNRAINLPLRNPKFCAQLAIFYLLYLWILQSASKVPVVALDYSTLLEYLAKLPITLNNLFTKLPVAVFNVMAHSPGSVLLTLGVINFAAMFTYTSVKKGRRLAFAGGMTHGVAHLTLGILLMWCMGRFNLIWLAPYIGRTSGIFLDDPCQVLLFILQTVISGGIIGGLLFGCWMVLTNKLFGWHSDEVFSTQGISDFKSFLRMRIDPSGLTIYPLKIESVCKRWNIGLNVKLLLRVGHTFRLRAFAGSGARFVPEQPIRVDLIERPIHIPVISDETS